MTDEAPEKTKTKRFRSPPYPAYDLSGAVERASSLYQKANHHPVNATVLAEAWNMKSVDGKVWRAAAALLQYGLLSDSGTGKSRKFQVTDIAKRIILDQNPDSEARQNALKRAALSPMIHNELWEKYQTATGLADTVVKTYLTIDRAEGGESPYSQAAADDVLNVYRSSLVYAGISDSDKVESPENDKPDESGESSSPKIDTKVKLGDYVKWTSNGIDQFEAKQVTWISDDGTTLGVFGSPTGIPMDQVKQTNPPGGKSAAPTSFKPDSEGAVISREAKPKGTGGSGKMENVSAYVVNGRLQLTADVGGEEIAQLKEMLTKYEEILAMMN